MDFLRLSDPRSGYAEPVNQIPSYAWGEGTGYYVEPKDQQTNFYIDHLARGSYLVWYLPWWSDGARLLLCPRVRGTYRRSTYPDRPPSPR